MKKTIFLILIGLFVAIPAALRAETVTVDVDQIRYAVDTDAGTAEVEGLTRLYAAITDLVIPDFIEYETTQYPVISIKDRAFRGETNLHGSLTLGDNIATIGDYAFQNCSGLTGPLTIPGNVTTIGGAAFSNCSGFTGPLTLGNNVTTIGPLAFGYCSGLTGSLTLGDNVTTIGNNAFSHCSCFTGSLTLGDNITTIGDGAFAACSGFTGSLIIPDNVTSIGNEAFYDCIGFTGPLSIPDNVSTIGNYAFLKCTGFAGSLTLGDNVTTIGDEAFSNCSDFTGSLVIPERVKSIGKTAFAGCDKITSLVIQSQNVDIYYKAFKMEGLESVTCLATTPPPFFYETPFGDVEDVFSYSNYSKPLYVPAQSVDLYKTATEWRKFTNITPLPISEISISLNKSETKLLVGESETLIATLEPEGATDDISWSVTADPVDCVSVENGKITAHAVGSAIITATYGEASASCKVTVNPIIATGITLNVSDMTLLVGATDKLTATVVPENVTDATITWTSDNEAVATVTADGTVTAVTVGVANITATCGEASAS
ncbi:MAG: leucine-rich repeat protein [Duncaniella sp.]|nr:leucine-rich repeat protein [Duncaniella sp.]